MVRCVRIRAGRTGERGFTLIELVIVMMIIGVLAGIAIPLYLRSVHTAKEAVLREDLQTLRGAIQSYIGDKEKAPQGLDDLVESGYLKKIPQDPITSRTDTWVTGPSETVSMDVNDQGGIGEVHSGSHDTATDGTNYSTW
jgi:general secretion pathway protein G